MFFPLFFHVLYKIRQFSDKKNFDKILRLNFKSIKSETDCYWSEKIPNIIFTTGTYAKSEKWGIHIISLAYFPKKGPKLDPDRSKLGPSWMFNIQIKPN